MTIIRLSGDIWLVALAAYDPNPTSIVVPGYRLDATAPSKHQQHNAEHQPQQPSSSHAVNHGYYDDGFRLPPAKRQKISPSIGPVPTNAKKNISRPSRPIQRAADTVTTSTPSPVPNKSRRVRTGCLTCRERHLKCDEGTPDCNNCRKSNRECKRGVRLNFIDITCKKPPHIVSPEGGFDTPLIACSPWMRLIINTVVAFEDESRLIASEYRGGLERYPKLASPAATATSRVIRVETSLRRPDYNAESQKGVDSKSATMIHTPHSLYFSDGSQPPPDLLRDTTQYQSRRTSNASYHMGVPPSSATSAGYAHLITDPFTPTRDDSSRVTSHHNTKSEASTAASIARATHAGPPSTFRGNDGGGGGGGGGCGPGGQHPETGRPGTGMMTPPSEKAGEREYLNSPEELRFMQVFVAEVGIWMDSLDREKHFSRMIPYHALRCPMLLNALLACGVKHLTLTQQYGDDKALFYYDTATTQLLRSLQNPERNTAECAATAVVLNVYEIMSEKPAQRMSHIAGARALIRECGWSARSGGLGAACFWLNVGMELLSCLAFNWQTTWDPDQWGVDMGFLSSSSSSSPASHCSNDNDGDTADNKTAAMAAIESGGGDEQLGGADTGNEEVWVHRIFFIVAKIANFRASIPKFQEPSPHDEQMRLQTRHAEWQRLKSMCDSWNEAVPRAMHPFGYVYPSQAGSSGKSLFPNVW